MFETAGHQSLSLYDVASCKEGEWQQGVWTAAYGRIIIRILAHPALLIRVLLRSYVGVE